MPEHHVDYGGSSKEELRQRLREHHISLNSAAEQLLDSDHFTTSPERHAAQVRDLTVEELGHPEGATLLQVFETAAQAGLSLCPLELAVHFRLQFPDQPEGHKGKPERNHRAPYGSITVASPVPSDDHDFPKGFYLRRIDGALWLRGYRSDFDHIWDPDDRFAFRIKE